MKDVFEGEEPDFKRFDRFLDFWHYVIQHGKNL